jgi:small-conductance mechanosensitive channel
VNVDLDQIEEALTGQNITGTDALVALGLVLVGAVLYVVLGRVLRRVVARWPPGVVPGELSDLAIRVAQFLTMGVFVAWALTVLGANVGWLTFLIFVVLVVGAFVAKPFIDSLVSSVLVATRSAFSVGDEIEVDGVVGEVVRIANRSTVMRTRDGRRVHIPNSELIDKTVTVYTAYEERRSSVELTVALDTDIEFVERVVREALDAVDSVRRVGSIRARAFTEGVELSIRFWHSPRLADGNEAIDAAVRAIKGAFRQAGIEFAPSASIRIEQPSDLPTDAGAGGADRVTD